MRRVARIRAIERAAGSRKLVYFGTRAADSAALLALPQFREVYALSAAMGSPALEVDMALEMATGRRPDARTYSLESDASPAVTELREKLRASFAEPALVVAYKPRPFLWSALFPRLATARLLGPFHDVQHALSHKPWVESSLAAEGVATVPWRYLVTAEEAIADQARTGWPMVLRTARSESGLGLTLVHDASALVSAWAPDPDGFVAVAPYLGDAIPVNGNGVASPDGSVSIHPASLQLIGISWLTAQRFGYCGNDFTTIRDLADTALDDLDELLRRVGAWLARQGYVGGFGIDALVERGQVLLVEVNARFQGSSMMGARLDAALDRSDMYLEHVAAFLGLAPADSLGLRELTRAQPPLAHAVMLNAGSEALVRGADNEQMPPTIALELLAPAGVAVDPGGVLLRAVVDGALTTDGFHVPVAFEREARAFRDAAFRPVANATVPI